MDAQSSGLGFVRRPPGSQRFLLFACEVLYRELSWLIARSPHRIDPIWLSQGLHDLGSERMVAGIQRRIDEIEPGDCDAILLGFGLCNNGTLGLHCAHAPLVMPKAHDCITLFLGSRQRYQELFAENPGTYYLTKGWLESGSNPLQEYHEYSARYKHADVMWILDQQYQHYERLALVASDPVEMALYRDQAQAVAHFCQRWGMRYEEILGSDDYVRRLIDAAGALSQNGRALPTGLAADLVLIPPGGEIRQEMFMR